MYGIYIVEKSYFFYNKIFFPTSTNFYTFSSLLFKKVLTGVSNKGLHPHLSCFNISTVFYLRFLMKTFYKNKVSSASFLKIILNTKPRILLKFLVGKSLPSSPRISFLLNFTKKIRGVISSIDTEFTVLAKRRNLFNIFYEKTFLYPELILRDSRGDLLNNNNKCFIKIIKPKELSDFYSKKFSPHNFINFNSNFFFKKTFLFFVKNTLILKNLYLYCVGNNIGAEKFLNLGLKYSKYSLKNNTNLVPNSEFFRQKLVKKLYSTSLNTAFKGNLITWVYTNFIKFIEFCLGKRALLNIYSFLDQFVADEYIIL